MVDINVFFIIDGIFFEGVFLLVEIIIGYIQFENVFFVYFFCVEQLVFCNVNFVFLVGKYIVFVGFLGSGKFIIVVFVVCLQDFDFGVIILDGIDIKILNVFYFCSFIFFVQ